MPPDDIKELELWQCELKNPLLVPLETCRDCGEAKVCGLSSEALRRNDFRERLLSRVLQELRNHEA